MVTTSRRKWPVLFLAAVLLAGCGDSVAPDGPVGGSWRSDTVLSTLKTLIDVHLTHRDTVIEGRGVYQADTPAEMVVIGFYSSTSTPTPVILTFSAVNTLPAILFGRLSSNGDTLSGEYRWAFGALPPDTVVFVRY